VHRSPAEPHVPLGVREQPPREAGVLVRKGNTMTMGPEYVPLPADPTHEQIMAWYRAKRERIAWIEAILTHYAQEADYASA